MVEAMENGGVITMESVDEVEGAVDEVTEVLFNLNDISDYLLLKINLFLRWPWTGSGSSNSNHCMITTRKFVNLYHLVHIYSVPLTPLLVILYYVLVKHCTPCYPLCFF